MDCLAIILRKQYFMSRKGLGRPALFGLLGWGAGHLSHLERPSWKHSSASNLQWFLPHAPPSNCWLFKILSHNRFEKTAISLWQISYCSSQHASWQASRVTSLRIQIKRWGEAYYKPCSRLLRNHTNVFWSVRTPGRSHFGPALLSSRSNTTYIRVKNTFRPGSGVLCWWSILVTTCLNLLSQ